MRKKLKRVHKHQPGIICNCDSFNCHSQEHMQQPHPPLWCWMKRSQRRFRQSLIFRSWDEDTKDRRKHGWSDEVSREVREADRLDSITPIVATADIFSNRYGNEHDVVFGAAFPNRLRRTNVISEKHAQLLLDIEREQCSE